MLTEELSILIVVVCCAIGLIWAIMNTFVLAKMKMSPIVKSQSAYNQFQDVEEYNPNEAYKIQQLLEIAGYIERGSNTFLIEQYRYIGVACVVMAFVIFFAVEEETGQVWTTVAFLLGSITSVGCGYIGMRVATFANYRCAYKAQENHPNAMSRAFNVAYRAGCIMGFTLVSLGTLVLLLIIVIYQNSYISEYADFTAMYECIAGYGLGGSFIALFARVGGGIYTKAADVGSDLVGKLEAGLKEDSIMNPGVIADNVGDNVGDIAGMGADLFGSFAEATSACLVIASSQPTFYYHPNALFYPLIIASFGIIVSVITSMIAFTGQSHNFKQISDKLKLQLLVSSILMVPALYIAAYITLPDRLYGFVATEQTYLAAFFCTLCGLAAGLAIGYITEYYTSHSYTPVREIAKACETGAATNIIYGLALGNYSAVWPVIILACTTWFCHTMLGMFGISLAALGILSNLCITLAIDAYGPVADNAGGLVEMCNFGEEARRKTDALDAAGNTTAAIGKGFAISSAGLVALALYGAYLTRAKNTVEMINHPLTTEDIALTSPLLFSGLLAGAVIPYLFAAQCMRSVGNAASDMVKEIRSQFKNNPGIKNGTHKPDYEACISIATKSSLSQLAPIGFVVLIIPLLIGPILGTIAIAGYIPGILVSGVCMAISQSNSGGAWDNAKKFIEGGSFTVEGQSRGKGSKEHAAAVVGDTVGDPLKDTSGPSLNILIKLTAIFSLIFVKFFDSISLLQCQVAPESMGC